MTGGTRDTLGARKTVNIIIISKETVVPVKTVIRRRPAANDAANKDYFKLTACTELRR